MRLLLFSSFLLCEPLMYGGQGEERNNETGEIIGEYHSRDILKYPLSNGFISGSNLLQPSSAWGCEKHSTAVEVVTKKAITFARGVTIYLQSGMNDLEESANTSTPNPVKELKLNVLHTGIDLYRDLALIVQVLWHDSRSAISMLGKELSSELDLQISRLPLPEI